MMTAASAAFTAPAATTATAVATTADAATPAANSADTVITAVAVTTATTAAAPPSQVAFINIFFPTVIADFIGIPNKCPRYRRESRLVPSERSLALLHMCVVAL